MVEIRGDSATIAGFKAGKYIRGIRNSAKKEYARAYFSYILKGRIGKPPEYGPTLSYMAAQAVRMHLDQLFPTLESESVADPQ